MPNLGTVPNISFDSISPYKCKVSSVHRQRERISGKQITNRPFQYPETVFQNPKNLLVTLVNNMTHLFIPIHDQI